MTKDRAVELIAEYELSHGREPKSYTMIPAYAGEQIARECVERGECHFINMRSRGRPKIIRPGMRGLKVNKTISIDVTSAEFIEDMSNYASASSVVEDALELLRDEKASGLTHEAFRSITRSRNIGRLNEYISILRMVAENEKLGEENAAIVNELLERTEIDTDD